MIHENADDMSLFKKKSQKVESGSMFKIDDVDYDHVLQITDTATKFCKFVLNSSEFAWKKITLQTSDKSRHWLSIKVAGQLNDTSGNLKKLVPIKLQKLHVLKRSCEIDFPACSFIICSSLKVIGFSNILVETNKTPNNSKKDESTKKHYVTRRSHNRN